MVNVNTSFDRAVDITTTTPADDLDEVQRTIELALYGDGVHARKVARKHTIVYRMIDGNEVTEEVTDDSFPSASFTVAVQHKKDESVGIVVTIDNRVVSRTRHWLAKIF